MASIDYLTAETIEGREAIAEIAQRAIPADIATVPPEWAIVRRTDGVPVSFALVDPQRRMRFSQNSLAYGYITTAATRSDHRLEGHFRGLLEEVFHRLIGVGVPLVVLHGERQLYRRMGFDIFTYHAGIFCSPGLIEHAFGNLPSGAAAVAGLEVCESYLFDQDLLYIVHAPGGTAEEARATLLMAAMEARARKRSRILIEHPDAPSFGSTYPVQRTLRTPLADLARSIGARVVIQGADMEGDDLPESDWLKVIDTPGLIRSALVARGSRPVPDLTTRLWLETDAGSVGLECDGRRVTAFNEPRSGANVIHIGTNLLGQLVTGYRSAALTSVLLEAEMEPASILLLDALFPPGWRLSSNFNWIYPPRGS